MVGDTRPVLPDNPNDSSDIGFIAPAAVPEYDNDLDDLLQAAVAGICNMPGWLVRPRLQSEPANQPPANYDWCAVGIVRMTDTDYAYQAHIGAGEGTNTVQDDEDIEALVSFFGPNAGKHEKMLRLGMQVPQNTEVLRSRGLEFVQLTGPTIVPSLIKDQFIRRVDSTLFLRRRVELIYPVRNIQETTFTVLTDVGFSESTAVVFDPSR